MRAARPRLQSAMSVLAVGILLAGCGKAASEQSTGGGPIRKLAPLAPQGAVSVATGNTTRLGGADAATDAAAVARAVYPGLTAATRPQVVALVNRRDWSAALAASVLSAAPIGAPVLYSEGDTLPEVSRETLEALHPRGAPALDGVQVIRIGTSASVPDRYLTRSLEVGDPAVTAAAVERLALSAVRPSAPRQVIIVPAAGTPALVMPAAGLSAESGAPILLVTRARVPAATAAVLAGLHRPSIYVIDPSQVDGLVAGELRRFGPVTAITSAGAGGAVANAIAVARFTDGSFGWGVKEPGHGLVFANSGRALDAPASALLSATANYGPLLLLESPTRVPPALASYLGDIQPAYTAAPAFRPVRGVYNHGWLIGDEQAIAAVTQAEIDSLLQISPRKHAAEEPPVSQVE